VGDIAYIASKDSLSAGPNNFAESATKADQVRLLAAELGEVGIRFSGVNPDGVVRAAANGVPGENLSEDHAQRTLLKRKVLPEHVTAAVFALTGPDLAQSIGLHIPVDSGVAGAFLR